MIRRNVSRLVYSLVWCWCAGALAQSPVPSPPLNSTLHILAEVRLLSGDPLRGLRPGSFRLSGSGHLIRFLWSSPHTQLPLSVLVLISSAADLPSTQRAADYLRAELPRSTKQPYRLGVLGPKGEYVPLRAPDDALSTFEGGPVLDRSYPQAVQGLARCKGQRAILYVTNRLSDPPLSLISEAQSVGALIYAVGGNTDQNYDFFGQETQSTPLGNYSEGAEYGPVLPAGPAVLAQGGADISEIYAVRSIRTVYMEPSISAAFREMHKVSLGLYSFSASIPASLQTIQLQPKISGEYQLDAYAYVDSEVPPPALELVRKAGASTKRTHSPPD